LREMGAFSASVCSVGFVLKATRTKHKKVESEKREMCVPEFLHTLTVR